MYEDDEPELAGYQPHGDKPLRSPHLMTVMRIVVVLGLIALVLPGILVGMGTAGRTAEASCAAYTAYYAPDAASFSVRFELISPTGIGWNCYATDFTGNETPIASLGLIPGGARLPSGPLEDS